MAKVNISLDRNAAAKIADMEGVDLYVRERAIALGQVAKAIFLAQVKHTHPVTFPAYADSFKVRRARAVAKKAWHAYNDDPAAFWVEFGAYLRHPTHERILRYRPLGRAMDALRASGG